MASSLEAIARKEAELAQLKQELANLESNYVTCKVYTPDNGNKAATLKRINNKGLELQRKIESRERTIAKMRASLQQ